MKKQSVRSKKVKGQSQVFIQSLVNRNIGSRTGKDVKAGKKIDKDADGFDNFEAYWSESDADVTSNTTAHSIFSSLSGGQEKENQSTNHVQGSSSQPVGLQFHQTAKHQYLDSYSSQPIGGAAAYYFGQRTVGSRTGKNIKAGKNIRKFDDSFENFENYWSESEPDSILSFHKSVRVNDSKNFINEDTPQEEEENVSAVSGESDSEVVINYKHLSASGVSRDPSRYTEEQDEGEVKVEGSVEDRDTSVEDRDTSVSGGPHSEDNVSDDAGTGKTDEDSSMDKSDTQENHEAKVKDKTESDRCQDVSDHIDKADHEVTKRPSVDDEKLKDSENSKLCSLQEDSEELEGVPLEQSSQSAYTDSSRDDVTSTVVKRPDSMYQSRLSSAMQHEISAHIEVKEGSTVTEVEAAVSQSNSDEAKQTEGSQKSHVNRSFLDQHKGRRQTKSITEEHDGKNISVEDHVPGRRTRSQSKGSVGCVEDKTDQSGKLSCRQTGRQRRKNSQLNDEDLTVDLSSAKEMASSIKKSKSKKKKSEVKANETTPQVEIKGILTDKKKNVESTKGKRGRRKTTEEQMDEKRSYTVSTRSIRNNSPQKKTQVHDQGGQCSEEESDVSVKSGRQNLATSEGSVSGPAQSPDKPKTSQKRAKKSKQGETNKPDKEEETEDNTTKTLPTSETSIKMNTSTEVKKKSKEILETEEQDKTETTEYIDDKTENIQYDEEGNTPVLKLKAVKSTRKTHKPGQVQKIEVKKKSLANNLFPTVEVKVLKMSADQSSQESVDGVPVNSSPEDISKDASVDSGDEHQNLRDDATENSQTNNVDEVVNEDPQDSCDVAADGILEEEDELNEAEEGAEKEENSEDEEECNHEEEHDHAESASNTLRIQVEVHKETTSSELIAHAPSGKSSTMAWLNIAGDITGSISKNTEVTGTISNTPMHSFRTKKRLSYSKVLDESIEREKQELMTSGTTKNESRSSKQPVQMESVVEEHENDGNNPNTQFLSLHLSHGVSMATTDTDSMDENFWIVDDDDKVKKKKGKAGKKDGKVTSKKESVDSVDVDKTQTVDTIPCKKPGRKKGQKMDKDSKKDGNVKGSSKRKGKKSVSGDETSETDTDQKTASTKTKKKSISGKRQSAAVDSRQSEGGNDGENDDIDQHALYTDTPTSTKMRKRKSHDPSHVPVATGGKRSRSARVTKTTEVMNGSKKKLPVKANISVGRLSHLNLAGVGQTPQSGVSFRQRRRRSLSESEKTGLNSSCPANLSFSPRIDDAIASLKQLTKRKSSLARLTDTPPASMSLTPCLIQSGSAKSVEKKKRRVTISNIIEKASVSYTDSTGSESKLSPGRYSPAGCTDSSLIDITGSPVHIFETTNTEKPDPITAPPKSKIIYPKPVPDGLRRSQRVRLEPLEWYKNEHVIYQRRKSGNFVIAGVQPSREAEYIAAELEKKKRRAKQRLKQTKRTKVSRSKLLTRPNLSLHADLPTELDYTIHSELPIINPDTQEEVLVDCVAPVDSTLYVGSEGENPRDGDPYIICHAIQQPTFTAGHLLIAPLAEKPTQMLAENTLIFTIVHGKLSVTIHRGSTVLEAGDQFFVPRGNTYCLKNLRNEEAKLSFVNLIEENDL